MSYANSGAYPQASSSHFQQAPNPSRAPRPSISSDFDILEWYPAYESCQRYFLDHAQHEPGTQALCALVNIRLPFQWTVNPVHSSAPGSQPSNLSYSSYNAGQWPRPTPSPSTRGPPSATQPTPAFVSLVPYIRRLVVTGFDKPGILHGFFGDAYQAGVVALQDCERRNYLFAAKHGGWRSCKRQYDMDAEQTVPFLKPLQQVRAEELDAAEESWSSWLAMEDWEIGPRDPLTNERRAEGAARGAGGRSAAGSAWASNTFDSHLPDSY
ncbi:hypothetical protein AAFC00_003559 [Neodothiora populina]|uniref:Ilp is an apoptosis inhibitor n=1 Tax=Neodothiora populina TaxID=2781224 RepID=A0ABR3PEL7_9PEZI